MRLARRLRQQAEEDVTPSMLSALSSVERLGPLTLGELASAERIQPPTMTAIVGRLEESGLVVKEIDKSDRRFCRVHISHEGRKFLTRNRSRKDAYLAKRLAALSSNDLEAIRGAVVILEKLLEEES